MITVKKKDIQNLVAQATNLMGFAWDKDYLPRTWGYYEEISPLAQICLKFQESGKDSMPLNEIRELIQAEEGWEAHTGDQVCAKARDIFDNPEDWPRIAINPYEGPALLFFEDDDEEKRRILGSSFSVQQPSLDYNVLAKWLMSLS
jgi:hypothetical protein